MDIPPIKIRTDRRKKLKELDTKNRPQIGASDGDRSGALVTLSEANDSTSSTNPAVRNHAIISRCDALGLSLAQVERMAGAEHTLRDIAYVLGLDWVTLAPLKPRNWLVMAASTCSVSYRIPLTPEGLLEILKTGALPRADEATFFHFLEEAPLSVVVMAIEQASEQSGVAITQIWRNVDQIAAAWASSRLRVIAQ